MAIITDDKSVTFAELNTMARLEARQLLSLGIKEGQYVGVLASNSIDVAILFHALQYIGAIMVPLNIRLTNEELQWQLRDCHAEWLLFDKSHTDVAYELQQSVSDINYQSFAGLNEVEPSEEFQLKETVDLQMTQTIIYTSGTTGFPKGVQLSYGNHWWSAVSSALNLGLDHHDKWLVCVPLFHVSGLSVLVKSVTYGMPIELYSKFDADTVNQAIMQHKVTMISVVSTMLKQLLEDLGEKRYPSSFRCMLLGGGPAPKVLLDQCKEKHIPIYQSYGMTETASQIVTLSPEYMLSKLGSAGKTLFPAQLKIVKEGQEVGANEPGEIVVAGPTVTSGYLNNEEATKKTMKSGWLYSGDIGYLDDEGFLYVLDRRKDLIISGGENVYPAEIESVLLKYEAVDDAGVVGIEDDKWGQVPVAFVKIKSGYSFEQKMIKEFCLVFLARYKVPKYIYQIDELPRNASKKLLRRKLLAFLP